MKKKEKNLDDCRRMYNEMEPTVTGFALKYILDGTGTSTKNNKIA